MSVGTIEVELDLDGNRFAGQIKIASEQLETFGRTTSRQAGEVRRFEQSLLSTSNALRELKTLAGAWVGIQGLANTVNSLIQAQKAMQQMHYGLVSALGSTRAAQEGFEWITKQANELGLNLTTLTAEYTKFTASATALNVPLKEQRELFLGLSRSATVLHLSADQTKYAMMALSQMFSKGKIQAEELRRQLGEQVPGVVPRFMRAVQQMRKEADQAYMSFDDLLRNGMLDTATYLPAMIKAMNETSSGWELASQSMQAHLGRLSNAWLEFRNEVSTGLFSDLVMGGANFLTENLQRITNLASAAAVALAGRFASSIVSGMNKHVQGMREERRQLDEIAQRRMTARISEAKQTHERVADLKRIRRELQGVTSDYEDQLAKQSAAFQAERLKMKDMADQRVNAQGVGLGTAGRGHSNQLTQAMLGPAERMRRIEKEREVTRAALNRLLAQGTANEHALAAATLASEKAARRAEITERRLNRLRQQAMTTAMKNVGGQALNLLGGPLGIAMMGFSLISAAIYSANQRAKEAQMAFKELAKQAEVTGLTFLDLRERIENGSLSLGDTAKELLRLYPALVEEEKNLLELKTKQKNLEQEISLLRQGKFGREGGVDFNINIKQKDLNETKQKIEELAPLAGKNRAEFDKLEAVIRKSFSPKHVDLLLNTIKEFGPAILKEGMTGEQALMALIAKLDEASQAAVRTELAFSNMMKPLDQQIHSLQMDLIEKQYGKAARVVNETAHAMGGALLPGQAAEAYAKGKMIEDLTGKLKSMRDTQTASARTLRNEETEAQREAKKRADTINNQIETLERLNYTNREALKLDEKMTPVQLEIAKAQFAREFSKIKLTEAEAKHLKTAEAAALASEKEVLSAKRAREATESLAKLKLEISSKRDETEMRLAADLAAMTMTSREADRLRRLADLEREYAEEVKRINEKALHDKGVNVESEIATIKRAHAEKLALEQKHQADVASVRNDWSAGARVAMKEFRDNATNNFEQMKSFTTAAFDRMGDALFEFTSTGKMNFKEFMIDIIKMIMRIYIAKMIANLIPGGGPADVSGIRPESIQTTMIAPKFASGGIMKSTGPMPLHKYASGGIAREPQLALFGEGRLPEAYVPLPDGRSIPVTIMGQGMSGVQNSVQIHVSVNQDGQAASNEQATSTEARKLGGMIEGKVVEVLAKESRAGGILWKMKNG